MIAANKRLAARHGAACASGLTATRESAPRRTYCATMPSPLGELLLASDGEALTMLHMPDGGETSRGSRAADQPGGDWLRDEGLLRPVLDQLAAYFAGELREFDLPLRSRGTPFQQRVWAELRRIPYGQTISYRELARRIGQPTASRAVGMANGSNPIGLIVPCHRVIAANGGLGGYGGGLIRKRWLLEHEARVAGTVGSDWR